MLSSALRNWSIAIFFSGGFSKRGASQVDPPEARLHAGLDPLQLIEPARLDLGGTAALDKLEIAFDLGICFGDTTDLRFQVATGTLQCGESLADSSGRILETVNDDLAVVAQNRIDLRCRFIREAFELYARSPHLNVQRHWCHRRGFLLGGQPGNCGGKEASEQGSESLEVRQVFDRCLGCPCEYGREEQRIRVDNQDERLCALGNVQPGFVRKRLLESREPDGDQLLVLPTVGGPDLALMVKGQDIRRRLLSLFEIDSKLLFRVAFGLWHCVRSGEQPHQRSHGGGQECAGFHVPLQVRVRYHPLYRRTCAQVSRLADPHQGYLVRPRHSGLRPENFPSPSVQSERGPSALLTTL